MDEYVTRLLSKSIENTPIKKAVVVFGARQVGKTTLLSHLYNSPETRWFSGDNFEDVQLLTSLPSQKDVENILTSGKIIVIDEAQRIPSVALLIKRLVDLQTPTRILVTGSSSLDLAGGVMESAAGRTRSFTLWPFSFEEISRKISWVEAVRNLPEQLVFGSYPSIVLNPEERRENLTAYFDSVLFKDIFSFAGIRKYPAFQRLVKVLASRIGLLSTAHSLAQDTGLTPGTVEAYLELMEECFIIKILNSFSGNQANELRKSKKIYFCDLGIRNAAIGNFSPFNSRTPEEQGQLFENYFIMERIKRHSYEDPFVQHYFWRNKAASEIDLIECKDSTINAFEIKLSKDKVKPPKSFMEAYPKATFNVVNRSNFHEYLLPES